MAASNLTNNPYVQAGNQTVVSQITSAVANSVNNTTNNTQGALGSSGTTASALAASLASSGIPAPAAGAVMANQLDKLVSGSSDFFAKSSPSRITTSALANRNMAAQDQTNPETQIPSNQLNTNNKGNTFQYPQDMPAYWMTLYLGNYERADPYGNTMISPIGSIALPLPDGSGLVDNTSVRWDSQDLGPIGSAYDAIASKYNGEEKAALGDAAVLTGSEIVKSLGPEAASLASSASGLAMNPSTSMIFSGIDFRSFSFTWTFAPKNVAENSTLLAIINYLKSKQLPSFTSGSNVIFNYPQLVKPQIYPSTAFNAFGGDVKNQFQWCVIKSVNVSYSPQGDSPSFYTKSMSPAFIRLQLDIQEMEYRLPNKYGGQLNGTQTSGQIAGATLANAGQNLVKFVTDASGSTPSGGGSTPSGGGTPAQ